MLLLLCHCIPTCYSYRHCVLISPGTGKSCALGGAFGVAGDSWWEWLVGASASHVGSFFRYFGAEDQGLGQDEDHGVGLGVGQGVGQGGRGGEGVGGAAEAAAIVGRGPGGDISDVGMCAWSSLGNSPCDSPTYLKPFFNVFLAVWATVRRMQQNIVAVELGEGRGRELDVFRKRSMRFDSAAMGTSTYANVFFTGSTAWMLFHWWAGAVRSYS